MNRKILSVIMVVIITATIYSTFPATATKKSFSENEYEEKQNTELTLTSNTCVNVNLDTRYFWIFNGQNEIDIVIESYADDLYNFSVNLNISYPYEKNIAEFAGSIHPNNLLTKSIKLEDIRQGIYKFKAILEYGNDYTDSQTIFIFALRSY